MTQRLLQNNRLGSLARQRIDRADERYDIEGVLSSVASEGRVSREVGLHSVLKDDAADRDADGLPETAEKCEHGGCDGDVVDWGGGLDGEGHGGEEEADSDSRDEHEEDPTGDGGGGGEEVEEAGAEGGEGVAEPDGPAVVGSFGGDEADEHGAGDDGEGLRESGEAGVQRGEVLCAFEEEGHVVEDGPEDDAVDEGEEVGDACGGGGEDAEGEESGFGEEGFPEEEEGEAEEAED